MSDQGTNGGHKAMYWKKELPDIFNARDVISFAKKNGWELSDSLEIPTDQLKTWHYNNKPIFPLSYSGFAKTPTVNKSEYSNFPRWINKGLKVYLFKTGWLTYEPGTDNSIEVNGFVLISNEGNELSVYHLWGE